MAGHHQAFPIVRHLSKVAFAVAATLVSAPSVLAQSTSAGVGGQVFSAKGQPVDGAQVSIIHVESGTVSRATTDVNGRYAARGLRVGGPYTITISKPGQGTRSEDNIYLNLNQVSTVNLTLTGDLTTLETVSAVASGNLGVDVFSANKMGTGTNVTRESIEALPSATRNMQDFIRLDPRITQTSKADGAISAGGQNTRYNAIRIDGIGAGDPFGIESNNFPTERQPVSMDAIQEINIDLANYDTTIFGGTGAVINAVTRSGTNEYRGSAYYSLRDKDWVRSRLRGEEFNGFNKEETYGLTFGGPLVRDKLFFFANYERYIRSAPGVSLGDTALGRGNVTERDINEIITAANAHGFDPGDLSAPSSNKTRIEEYALKLDWNISDNHRAAMRFNTMKQNVMAFPGMSPVAVSFSSHWYDQQKTYDSWMGELFSNWGEHVSTELKASWKKYSSISVTSADLPAIQILGFPGNSSVNLGTWINTHVNIVESRELSLFAAANLYLGNHTLKLGVDRQANDLMLFLGRNLNGSYSFDSLAAFQAGLPSAYSVRVGDIPVDVILKNTGVFLQDTWAITWKLNLMFGLRVDIPDHTAQPFFNPLIHELYGDDNTVIPSGKLVQPRFGFNYTFDSARPMQARGGIGLFAGAAPNAWLTGVYQNTGLNYVEYACNDPNAPVFSPQTTPNIPPGCGVGDARINVDIIEPGFKQPSVWKANLAFDHELPWFGMVASAEALWTRVHDGIYVRRLDVYSDANRNNGTIGPDGRLLFWNEAGLNPANRGRNGIDTGTNGAASKAGRPDGIGDIMLIGNTDKGRSRQLTIGVDKPVQRQWGWSLFYTRTRASEVSAMSNSQLTSNWGNTLVADVNENIAYDSRYAIRDRLSGQLHWQKSFFADYKTRVSVFYEGRSGRPYSYVFANDANGDGDPGRPNQPGYFNDLFYVPSGPGDVLWTGGEAMEQQFFAWLAGHPGLARHQGTIAPANAFRTGWSNSFDVRISQELPGFFKRHKTGLALDIMNIGNLINKNWGLIEDYGTDARSRVAHYAGIDPATGRYVYHFTGSATEPGIQENSLGRGNTAVSRWSVMLSMKYRF